jgi:predicted esterase
VITVRLVLLTFLFTVVSCGGGRTVPLAASAPASSTTASGRGPAAATSRSNEATTQDAARPADLASSAAPATAAAPESSDGVAGLEELATIEEGDADSGRSEGGVEAQEAWCPDGIETLPGPICAVLPDDVRDDTAPTLVIFLHGVTVVGSGWQIALIQGLERYARHQHFALLAPRAPRNLSKDEKAEVYAWRTSRLGAEGEAALLDGWMQAKATLEQRMGRPFAKVFVMGFSSGAYYVSSLALRGRLQVDGYAAFAGGSAPVSRSALSHVSPRVPIFVGYGLKDRAGSRDARGLVGALRAARWKYREMAVAKAGHTITTGQFTGALAFLRDQPPPEPLQPDPPARAQQNKRHPTPSPPVRKSTKRRKH